MRVVAATLGCLLMTRETVWCDTPANCATSVIAGPRVRCDGMLCGDPPFGVYPGRTLAMCAYGGRLTWRRRPGGVNCIGTKATRGSPKATMCQPTAAGCQSRQRNGRG